PGGHEEQEQRGEERAGVVRLAAGERAGAHLRQAERAQEDVVSRRFGELREPRSHGEAERGEGAGQTTAAQGARDVDLGGVRSEGAGHLAEALEDGALLEPGGAEGAQIHGEGRVEGGARLLEEPPEGSGELGGREELVELDGE